MTAGAGIVHSERTPEYLRHSDKELHGLQIWVALPKELEQMEPEFFHASEAELPHWETNSVTYKLIAGSLMGRQSPVPVFSPLYFLEIKSKEAGSVSIGSDLNGEAGLYILEGSIETEGNVYLPKQLLVAKQTQLCAFNMAENTTVYIFGGEPFAEDRFIYWNFVASSQELIDQAKENWLAQNFKPVPGETDFVPLPAEPNYLKRK